MAREPTRVVLVGEGWAAELVTFRALRFGARVVATFPDPGRWIDLGRQATGRTDRMTVLAPGSPVSMAASADSPVLWVGLGSESAGPDGDLPAWTTRLSVLPPSVLPDLVTRPDRVIHLTGADMVLVERVTPAEAVTLTARWGLSPQTRDTLPVLPDGVLAVLTRAGAQYAWTDPTSTEQDALGGPSRS